MEVDEGILRVRRKEQAEGGWGRQIGYKSVPAFSSPYSTSASLLPILHLLPFCPTTTGIRRRAAGLFDGATGAKRHNDDRPQSCQAVRSGRAIEQVYSFELTGGEVRLWAQAVELLVLELLVPHLRHTAASV